VPNRQRLARIIDILLVEDNPGDVELTLEALVDSKLSNRIHTVDDGEKAMAFLRGEAPYASMPRPDLVLLDLNLPCKDGREVLMEMKADDRLKRIPVVILTSSAAETDILKSYDLGANCYVTKPMNLERFLEVVRCVHDFWLSIVTLPGSEKKT
jgi:two-component system, chemotaxis family, response regulator Rcp1